MIKEIVEFMDTNEGIEEYFIVDEPPKQYEHFYLKINKDDFSINIYKSDFWIYDELNDKEKTFIKYMTYYQKALFNKALDRIHGLKGSSPFILTINVNYNGEKFTTDIDDFKEPKGREKYFFNRIEKHFNDAKKYGYMVEELEKLKQTLLKDLENTIIQNNKFISYMKERIKEKDKVDITLRVYIDFGKLDTRNARKFNATYLEDSVFLSSKKEFIKYGKCSICDIENELSLPSFLNSFGDDFGQKITMPIFLTTLVCKKCSVKLYKFKVMTDKNQLTKPFPLFIDKPNLFSKQTDVLNDNEKKKSYREMIKSIYFTNPKDLKNFYLFSYQSVFNKGNKAYDLKIKDLDYIENFQYMTSIQLQNFLEVKNGFILNDFYNRALSVFQFEKIVNELIFDNKLQNNYFSDYKDIKITYWKINSNNANNLLKNYLLKYRQNFYDFIYKSHYSAFKLMDFREMLLDIIIDDINHDEVNKNGYSIYENEIKEKLNFLFSIENHIKERDLDSNELVNLKDKLKQNLGYWEEYKDNDTLKSRFIKGVDHIELKDENDNFFAYLVGQVARYMLSLSKAKKENLTHADFAGFLDWHNSKLLKSYVLDIFQKYAHEFRYSKRNGRLENAISIIQSYKDDLEMDRVKEYLIAGYFSDNYFYQKVENLEEN